MNITLKIEIKGLKNQYEILNYKEKIYKNIKNQLELKNYKTKKIEMKPILTSLDIFMIDTYKYYFDLEIEKINNEADSIDLKEGEKIDQVQIKNNSIGWILALLITSILGVISIEIVSIEVIKAVGKNAEELKKVNNSITPNLLIITAITGVVFTGLYFLRR